MQAASSRQLILLKLQLNTDNSIVSPYGFITHYTQWGFHTRYSARSTCLFIPYLSTFRLAYSASWHHLHSHTISLYCSFSTFLSYTIIMTYDTPCLVFTCCSTSSIISITQSLHHSSYMWHGKEILHESPSIPSTLLISLCPLQ